MSDISGIDEIIRKNGKDGLRFLLLFKAIKSQVYYQLKKQKISISENDDMLNQVCAFAAKRLLVQNDETPTEELITALVSKLANLKQ
jgi:hypothetical protein